MDLAENSVELYKKNEESSLLRFEVQIMDLKKF